MFTKKVVDYSNGIANTAIAAALLIGGSLASGHGPFHLIERILFWGFFYLSIVWDSAIAPILHAIS